MVSVEKYLSGEGIKFNRGFLVARWAETPATSRHTRRLLRLLPSGPDRVHKLVLREDQGLHRFCFLSMAKE